MRMFTTNLKLTIDDDDCLLDLISLIGGHFFFFFFFFFLGGVWLIDINRFVICLCSIVFFVQTLCVYHHVHCINSLYLLILK